MKLSLPKIKGLGLSNDAIAWGGLLLLGAATLGIAGTTLQNTGTAFERFGDSQIITQADKTLGSIGLESNFAWSEGFPWRDRSVWYQWKSDFQGNDPTKRLTVA
jgi:hypothetical protein